MPRAARIVLPGVTHHVTQRGNNRQDVFFVDDDRRVYLELLMRNAERFGFRVEAYCLMMNHVHVLGVPVREDSLAKTFRGAHVVYTQYVNRLHGRSGHLWQNRFYSCAMDDEHTWAALRYVELNPVRAGLARKAWEYAWSSAAAHCGLDATGPILDLEEWRERLGGMDWREALHTPGLYESADAELRRNTRTGRPLGNDSFLSKVEHLLGRRIRPLPIGRQKGWRRRNKQVSSLKTE